MSRDPALVQRLDSFSYTRSRVEVAGAVQDIATLPLLLRRVVEAGEQLVAVWMATEEAAEA